MFHIYENFKKNQELNQFYISIFIRRIGVSLVGLFTPIFLYQLDYSIVEILFFYFLMSLVFLCISYPIAKIIAKLGEKHSMFIGNIFAAIFYMGLIFLDSTPHLFYILPVIAVPSMAFYWMSYHLLFTQESHGKKRGKEVSNIGIIIVIAGILSPYVGGLLANTDFKILFIISTVLMVISSVPLLFSKERNAPVNFSPQKAIRNTFTKKNIGNIIYFTSFGIENIINLVIWPIFIIIILGDLEKTGLIISLTTLLSLVTYKLIGNYSDHNDKIKLLRKTTHYYSFSLLLRIFAVSTPLLILIESIKNITQKALFVPLDSHRYDLAKRHDAFEFIFIQENFFKLARVIFLPILMIIFWIDFYPFTITLILASIVSLGYKKINS